MVYDNFTQMITDLARRFHIEDFGDKIFSVALTAVVITVLWRVGLKLLRRAFRLHLKLPRRQDDVQRQQTLERTLCSLYTWGIWTLFALLALSYFVNISALLAVAGIGGVTIGFGVQSLVADLLAGMTIIVSDAFNVGDTVQIDSDPANYGTVEDISVRTTTLRRLDGALFTIYNGSIKQYVNYSRGPLSTVLLVGVGLESDIARAQSVIAEAMARAAQENPGLFDGVPVVAGVGGMSPEAVQIKIIGKSAAPDRYTAQSVMNRAALEALVASGIALPVLRTENAGGARGVLKKK